MQRGKNITLFLLAVLVFDKLANIGVLLITRWESAWQLVMLR